MFVRISVIKYTVYLTKILTTHKDKQGTTHVYLFILLSKWNLLHCFLVNIFSSPLQVHILSNSNIYDIQLPSNGYQHFWTFSAVLTENLLNFSEFISDILVILLPPTAFRLKLSFSHKKNNMNMFFLL